MLPKLLLLWPGTVTARGWATPSKDSPNEVYTLSGDDANRPISLKYDLSPSREDAARQALDNYSRRAQARTVLHSPRHVLPAVSIYLQANERP